VHCGFAVQKRTEVFNNVKRAEAAATVLTFFGKQSRDMNCCMLCKRDFTSEEELGGCCAYSQMWYHITCVTFDTEQAAAASHRIVMRVNVGITQSQCQRCVHFQAGSCAVPCHVVLCCAVLYCRNSDELCDGDAG